MLSQWLFEVYIVLECGAPRHLIFFVADVWRQSDVITFKGQNMQ